MLNNNKQHVRRKNDPKCQDVKSRISSKQRFKTRAGLFRVHKRLEQVRNKIYEQNAQLRQI
jgi:hypothetical protein